MRKIIWAPALFLLITSSAVAEVKDYQIIRLIAMKSECNRKDLSRFYRDETSVSFKSKCTNVSHYPDGLTVHCIDKEDETSCKIMTAARQFNYLRLLQGD